MFRFGDSFMCLKTRHDDTIVSSRGKSLKKTKFQHRYWVRPLNLRAGMLWTLRIMISIPLRLYSPGGEK